MFKTPEDFRDQNFESIHGLLESQRLAVYEAWVKHGPGTTREIAVKSGIDLLNVRPRTTELVQIGLVQLSTLNSQLSTPHEGTYEAVTREQWARWRETRVSGQQQLI